MSDASHANLVAHCARQEAQKKRWNDHFARRTPASRRRPIIPDRVDGAAKFLQDLAVIGFFGFLLLACF